MKAARRANPGKPRIAVVKNTSTADPFGCINWHDGGTPPREAAADFLYSVGGELLVAVLVMIRMLQPVGTKATEQAQRRLLELDIILMLPPHLVPHFFFIIRAGGDQHHTVYMGEVHTPLGGDGGRRCPGRGGGEGGVGGR